MQNIQPYQHTTISRQRGASLIVVMMVLTVVSLLGIAGIQIATMSERGARNDRDMQIAWQAAEAALIDAEFDIFGPTANVSTTRRAIFENANDNSDFVIGCGTTGDTIGLCALVSTGTPAWLTVDFTATGNNAPTTALGTYTGRTFKYGGPGVQPAKLPRYIIEALPDPARNVSEPLTYIYRVTAMGFGPREDIQAVAQMIYRH